MIEALVLSGTLYMVPVGRTDDFRAFIWLYTSMLENGHESTKGIYVFDQSSYYWIEDNTALSINVKHLMSKHGRNFSTMYLLNPDGSVSFIFNCLNSNGKYEFYSVNAYKK